MLSINFHKTFMPERRLIASLLEYADNGSEGSFHDISTHTGIPMGKSSGKVPAILDYASGMYLVDVAKKSGGIRKPTLTPFGTVVFNEDPYLSEEMTQWLAHMNLCRSDIGALAWHEVFAKGRNVLGTSFTKPQLETYLVNSYSGKNRTGPMINMYLDSAAFERAGVIAPDKEHITRRKAPKIDFYARPYAAYILLMMEIFSPGENQITITEFNNKTFLFDICLWNRTDIEQVLAMVETTGFISIDRQMQPWLIEKMASSSDVWSTIYDEIA